MRVLQKSSSIDAALEFHIEMAGVHLKLHHLIHLVPSQRMIGLGQLQLISATIVFSRSKSLAQGDSVAEFRPGCF